MAKQKLLNSLFTTLSKEEMEVNVESEFAALNSKLELEKAMKKPEAEKRPVERPKKEMDVILLSTKLETPVKSSSKPSMSRGTYTNWFVPSLWDPIFETVSKHRNLPSALRYLQLKYIRPGENVSVYDKLAPSTLKEWFTSTGELKAGTKQYIFKETAAYTGGAQHADILANHPKLEEDIITLLKNHRDAGQSLYASCAQVHN